MGYPWKCKGISIGMPHKSIGVYRNILRSIQVLLHIIYICIDVEEHPLDSYGQVGEDPPELIIILQTNMGISSETFRCVHTCIYIYIHIYIYRKRDMYTNSIHCIPIERWRNIHRNALELCIN